MEPDHVYTSYLKRAVKTAWLALGEMGREYSPETRAWQLNERMYGLAGLTPQEAYAKCVVCEYDKGEKTNRDFYRWIASTSHVVCGYT